MLVHRLLDVVFRTLDAIDAVRARVDAVLGNDPQPPSAWSPEAPQAPASVASPPSSASDAPAASPAPARPAKRDARNVVARGPSTKKPTKLTASPDRVVDEAANTSSEETASIGPPAKKPSPKKSGAPKAGAAKAGAAKAGAAKAGAAKAGAAKAGATKTGAKSAPSTDSATPREAGGVGRKGSVDRSGRDLESPRARAIETWLKETGRPLVADDAALDGKRTLARVLWAVACAEDAGSEQGLTAADASAFLSSAAGVEVFTTNVGRTFRDESALFVETIPDGRSKRYKLTPAGRARLAGIRTR